MLRITPSHCAHAATDYHIAGLAQAAYYTGHGPGVWHGKGAARLGLSGDVTRADFAALAEGRHPLTGQKLVQRLKDNRRVGMDFVFSAPKSLTLLYEYRRDGRLLTAFSDAARETMRDIEQGMQTQSYDAHGKKCWTLTANLIWTQFLDFESRPTDFGTEGEGRAAPEAGSLPDPHLHCHAFAFAPTFDPDKQRWQAGEFGGIKMDGAYYEALFHNRLAAKIRALGYTTVPTACGRWWEIAGVSRRLIEKFSRRTAEIQDTARREGITDAADLDKLGAITRQGKSGRHTLEELRALWRSRLSDADRQELENAGKPQSHGSVTAEEAIAYALEKSLERHSVVESKRLMTEALRYGAGHTGAEDIAAALGRQELLTWEEGDRTWVTTWDVAEEEGAMCRYVRESLEACAPLKAAQHTFTPAVAADGQPIILNEGQIAAVKHVLTARDKVMAIRGVAGSGKTTLLREAVAGIEESGKAVYTFAPTTGAADVLRAEGFGNAATLQQLLASPVMQARMKDQVILVDEAGLVSVRQMKELFDIAEEQGARVILVGDEGQHGSVERSDVNVMRILREHAGLRPAEVTDIKRQRPQDYREAVRALSHADVGEGFARLEAMGAIQEIPDHQERYARLATEYLEAIAAGHSALIIAPTHAEGDIVTGIVREGLKGRGVVGAEEQTAVRLKHLDWTAADRRHAAFYQEGLVIEFTHDARGIRRGVRVIVTGHDARGNVLARDRAGATIVLPLGQAERFQVYEAQTLALAAGDTIRITRNGEGLHGARLVNGALAEVAGFTEEGHIRLAGGAVVHAAYGHIEHGYVSTSHKAQGLTVDKVFIAETASYGAASPAQLYVSASRAREEVRLYTGDKAALLHAVSRERPALCAAELLRRRKQEEEAQDAVRKRRDHAREVYRLHHEQERQDLLRLWPAGTLQGLWRREKRRGRGVAAGLRRIWRAITGQTETLPASDLRLEGAG
jgi:hypothetical protein